MHKVGQSGGFLGRILGPSLKTGLSLMKNILKTLVKSVLIPLGLTAAASATDAFIRKKMFRSGMTTLIISNEEMKGIIKIFQSLEESSLLIKGVSPTIKNEAKERKTRFLSMLSGTLSASLLGNLLTGKGVIRADGGTIRAGQDFEMQKYYQNVPKFNGVYSRNTLPKIKDGAYVILMSMNQYELIG